MNRRAPLERLHPGRKVSAMLQAGDTEIREVEIEYEALDGSEGEYEYEVKAAGKEKGQIEIRSADGKKDKRRDEASLAEIKRLVESMKLHPDLKREELIARACEALALDRSRLRNLEVEVEFTDGREVRARLH